MLTHIILLLNCLLARVLVFHAVGRLVPSWRFRGMRCWAVSYIFMPVFSLSSTDVSNRPSTVPFLSKLEIPNFLSRVSSERIQTYEKVASVLLFTVRRDVVFFGRIWHCNVSICVGDCMTFLIVCCFFDLTSRLYVLNTIRLFAYLFCVAHRERFSHWTLLPHIRDSSHANFIGSITVCVHSQCGYVYFHVYIR